MMNLNKVQREELLKEMKALAEKYGVDIVEKTDKEKTDIQKGKDTIFSLLNQLDMKAVKITDSTVIVEGDEAIQTETVYGKNDDDIEKLFRKIHPHAIIINKSYVKRNKKLGFTNGIKYTFNDLAYYRIQIQAISENSWYNEIFNKQQKEERKEERKIKKIEKLFNDFNKIL